MRRLVAVVNYGSGNFTSVWNALTRLDVELVAASDPATLRRATHVVLPGVGAFGACMRRLSESGLANAIVADATAGKPLLGICVGMQVLGTTGEEHGAHDGLGLIPGAVRRLDAADLRLPHIGWNNCAWVTGSALRGTLPDQPDFYFVHSYHLEPDDPTHVVAVCEYGAPITAIVEHGNVFGVQFHPEKSQDTGLALLRSFTQVN